MIYPASVRHGVSFSPVYCGYLEENYLPQYQSMRRPFTQRSVDVGQRVRLLSSTEYGDFAARKAQTALAFAEEARCQGFVCDVSTAENDRLSGDAWLRFLGDTRFTLTAESGASRIDATGSIARRARYLRLMAPRLTELDLVAILKLSEEPQIPLKSLSGRFFEAAAMGCCQVLLPGKYPSGLEAGVHYLALDEDLSNSSEVLEQMRDQDSCESIADNCLEAVLSDESNTYRGFVDQVLRKSGISDRQT